MDFQDHNECSRAHAPSNLYLSDKNGSRSRAGTTGSNESGIAMTASPSHDTKELNFNLGTSPTQPKGIMLPTVPVLLYMLLCNIEFTSGSEDEGIDVGQKRSAHVSELKETKIELEIDQQEIASTTKPQDFQLEHTLELSRPLTSLGYLKTGYKLISAGTGMVTIILLLDINL